MCVGNSTFLSWSKQNIVAAYEYLKAISLANISISQSIGLTFISDAEACRRAAVVRREQQEQDVGCGNQEMRCLGAVILTDEGRRG